MKVKVTKTYKGWVELRDYDVQNCIDKKESITVVYGDGKMTLSPEELQNNVANTSALMKSKTGGKDYHLIAYEWNPDF